MKVNAAAALAASAAVCCASAWASSDSHTLSVSATVTETCKFQSAGPTDLIIANDASGAIDPSVASAATGTASVTFRCTNGTTSVIAAGNGLYFADGTRKVSDGTNVMPYALTLTGDAQVGSGHGDGQDKTLTVDASIAVADFQNAAAGTYSDTVVLTITP